MMNMIVFEFRDAEKKFFEEHKFQDLNITFFSEPLNEDFVETLDQELLDNTNIISVLSLLLLIPIIANVKYYIFNKVNYNKYTWNNYCEANMTT